LLVCPSGHNLAPDQLIAAPLHRCLQRHGISRLPQIASAAPGKRKFKIYPLGYFHVDIAEVQTARAGSTSWLPSAPPRQRSDAPWMTQSHSAHTRSNTPVPKTTSIID
jgi:hypothetical protein